MGHTRGVVEGWDEVRKMACSNVGWEVAVLIPATEELGGRREPVNRPIYNIGNWKFS